MSLESVYEELKAKYEEAKTKVEEEFKKLETEVKKFLPTNQHAPVTAAMNAALDASHAHIDSVAGASQAAVEQAIETVTPVVNEVQAKRVIPSGDGVDADGNVKASATPSASTAASS